MGTRLNLKPMKTLQLPLGILSIAALLLAFYFYAFSLNQAHATNSIAEYVPMTSGAVSCPIGASKLLMATSSSGRNLAYISDDSATGVYLGLGVPAATSTGVLLNASTTMRFDATGSYAGAVYCMSNGSAAATTSYSDSNF